MPISEKKDLKHQPDLPPKKPEKEQNKPKPSRREKPRRNNSQEGPT